MAKLNRNVYLEGSSGHVNDKLVYMQRGNKTFVREASRKSLKLPTEGILAHRTFFRQACNYAKKVMLKPGKLEMYKKGAEFGISAYNAAIRDFMKPPVVQDIDASEYTGAPGDILIITAVDDFKVDKVHVTIHQPNGDLLEEGDAEPARSSWLYTTTQANAVLPGTRITATAYDLPGNTGALEVAL